MIVLGTRPQFIKSAPLVKEIVENHMLTIDLTIVHTGQHYDFEMSELILRELKFSKPILNLYCGSGSHAVQTGSMMKRLEKVFAASPWSPDLVLVPGDTNSTLSAALCAAKLHIPVAHLEAGMRSGDMTMPEEVNRKLTDHCSSLHFAPTQTAMSNLKREGIEGYMTGDTMVDALHLFAEEILLRQQTVRGRFWLQDDDQYVLVTLHRPSNVDNPIRLRAIWNALKNISRQVKTIFPAHPRTYAKLNSMKHHAIILVKPQGYIEAIALLRGTNCLLTDSGGMSKEAFLLNVPCVTVRTTTEWPETLFGGANELVSVPEKLYEAVLGRVNDGELRRKITDMPKDKFGDGHASEKIAKLLERYH